MNVCDGKAEACKRKWFGEKVELSEQAKECNLSQTIMSVVRRERGERERRVIIVKNAGDEVWNERVSE